MTTYITKTKNLSKIQVSRKCMLCISLCLIIIHQALLEQVQAIGNSSSSGSHSLQLLICRIGT